MKDDIQLIGVQWLSPTRLGNPSMIPRLRSITCGVAWCVAPVECVLECHSEYLMYSMYNNL